MTIGLSINGRSHSKTPVWLRPQRFDAIQAGPPFLLLAQEDKRRVCSQGAVGFPVIKNGVSPVKIKNVLHSFEKNKTPAEDGFSKEFYETFFDHLKQNLLDWYNEAFQKGSLSVSQRRGVISLKNDCDLSELTGWRPITFFYFLLCINVVNLLSIKKNRWASSTYFTREL